MVPAGAQEELQRRERRHDRAGGEDQHVSHVTEGELQRRAPEREDLHLAGLALDLLWTSRKVGAQEAERKGLVEFLTGPDDLMERARAYICDLAENVSPSSIRETKRLVYNHLGMEYDPALREAHEATMASLHWEDSTEGVRSFVQRRPPHFQRLRKQ